MTVDLSQISFVNDLFSVSIKDGGTVTLTKIDENIEGCKVCGILIVITNELKGIWEKCPSIIGLKNEFIRLYSIKKELQGKALTEEFMPFCFLEIFENDEDDEDDEELE